MEKEKAGVVFAPNRLDDVPVPAGVPKRGVEDVFANEGVAAAPKAGVLAPPKLKLGVCSRKTKLNQKV